MVMIALTSASGAPGVTTAALGLAISWPREVLLSEVALTGASSLLAGYWRGESMEPDDILRGTGDPSSELVAKITDLRIPILGSPAHALPMGHSMFDAGCDEADWTTVASALRGEEGVQAHDTIVDAGRLGSSNAPLDLLRQADRVLLVLTSTLPAVAAARCAAEFLQEDLALNGTVGSRSLALCVVGSGQPYEATDIAKLLALPYVGSVADDPVASEVLSLGAPPAASFGKSPLMRSIRRIVDQLAAPQSEEDVRPHAG